MAFAGRPEENGYSERLIRTIKEKHVSLTEYQNMADARDQIAHFIEDVFQRRRILGNPTPKEYEERWSKEHINK